jgi:hypothetical protein
MLPEAGRSRSSPSPARADGAPTQHDARDQAYQRCEQYELGEPAAAVGADAEHHFDPIHGSSPLSSSAVRDGLQVQQHGAVGALQRHRIAVLYRLGQRADEPLERGAVAALLELR